MTADEAARLPHSDHGSDVVAWSSPGVDRLLVTNDGAAFAYAKTAVNALRDRLRASAVIEAVADLDDFQHHRPRPLVKGAAG